MDSSIWIKNPKRFDRRFLNISGFSLGHLFKPNMRKMFQLQIFLGNSSLSFAMICFIQKARHSATRSVEIKDLAVLYGLLHFASQKINESHPLKVAELQKLPEWRSVMVFAKELEANLDISEQ
jgi:hypothetical protein